MHYRDKFLALIEHLQLVIAKMKRGPNSSGTTRMR
jgi:hypothetical protein